jgi:TolA-binding protein
VRPSPERLDAQIRQLVHSIESLKEQNREQYKTIISKLDDLRISVHKENKKMYPQKVGMNRNQEEDSYGFYNEEDYR